MFYENLRNYETQISVKIYDKSQMTFNKDLNVDWNYSELAFEIFGGLIKS